jgi:hypothetical protein
MTPLWTENISILYEKRYIFEVLPNKKFDFNRKLNSLLRLSIYYTIIMYFIDRTNTNLFFIPFIAAGVTFILKKFYKNKEIQENTVELINEGETIIDKGLNNYENDGCRVSTEDNPFMNPPLFNNNSKKSCQSYNNKEIQRKIEQNFNKDLYKDANDIFGKNNSQRQFYSVPGKSIPNDQEAFAQWLYSTPPTCKEGNGIQCSALSAEYRGTGVGMAQGPSG